jgi:transcriptional regulator with XRE-family HTH domain
MAGGIGDIFRERRELMGLTVEHVCLATGISPLKMRSIENGRDRKVGTGALQVLMDLYGLKLSVADEVERPRVLAAEFYRHCRECGRMRMIGTMCKNPRTGECDNNPDFFL